jgi:hypothetical protein
MNLNLHKNARTTPTIRQELRESTQSERELAREYHLNRATVRQWRRRDNDQDASHHPHRLHTTLTPALKFPALARTTTSTTASSCNGRISMRPSTWRTP